MQQKFAAHPPSPARRRVSASCTGRDPAANLRCGNTSQSAYGCQLPSRGALPSQTTGPEASPGGEVARRSRDGEVCRPQGGGAEAPSAHADALRQTFGAATPLRRSAPAPLKGSLPSQTSGPVAPVCDLPQGRISYPPGRANGFGQAYAIRRGGKGACCKMQHAQNSYCSSLLCSIRGRSRP